MPALNELLDSLLTGRDMDEATAAGLVRELASGEVEPVLAGALLAALRAKGETPGEIRGLADGMRGLAVDPGISPDLGAVDVVGTGGDGSGSLNLSTGTALLAAACGVPVVKHGNRSVSSRSGSADVLEALGVSLPAGADEAAALLERSGFTFLFAPYFHPAMKAVVPVRRAMGVRTAFNILGPLTNPASPPFLLLGAFSPDMAELMARAVAGSDVQRAWVIHGAPGWDEATPVGEFLVFEAQGGEVIRRIRDPEEMGVPRCTAEDLAGGDAGENAARLAAVLEGREHGPHRDALVLGAALVLELTGRSEGGRPAAAAAAAAIDDGRGAALLERLKSGG